MLSEFSFGYESVFTSVPEQVIYVGNAHFSAHLFLLVIFVDLKKKKKKKSAQYFSFEDRVRMSGMEPSFM